MTRPLRIGLLTPLYELHGSSRSGIAKHYRHLADALAAEGHVVTVIFIPDFYADQPAACDQVTPEGVRVICRPVRLPGLLRRVLAGRSLQLKLAHALCSVILADRILRELSPGLDVVETTSFGALGLGGLAGSGWPPCITRVSTTSDQISAAFQSHRSRAQSLVNQLERIAILRSPALLTHTRRHARTIEAVLGLRPPAFAIVPHGLPDLPAPAATPVCAPWHKGPTLLFAGQFTARKAIDVVLAAAPDFLTACTQARLIIAGGPAGDGRTRRTLDDLHVTFGPRLVFVPDPDDATLHAWMHACDIFTAPSRYESFGLIYLEAMRAGKPVVATDVGGIPEVVSHGKTGLLVPPGDATALASAWQTLVENRPLAAAHGDAGRRRFLDFFTSTMMARQSAALYLNVIHHPTKRGWM